jgi:hypothetical protein
VELTELVGIYSRPYWQSGGMHLVLFSARPVSGELRPDPNEVIEAAYFDPQQLPEPFLPWQHQQIRDVLAGIGGSRAWRQNTVWPFEQNLSRQAIYDIRDQSRLSRRQFYEQYFAHLYTEEDILEVDGKRHVDD